MTLLDLKNHDLVFEISERIPVILACSLRYDNAAVL